MKKNLKRLLCLVLAAVMAFSLAACGGNSEEGEKPHVSDSNKDKGEHPDFVYTSEFVPVEDNDFGYIRMLCTSDKGVYCAVEEVVGENIPEGAVKEYEGQFDVCEMRIYLMDYNGKMEPLPGYVPVAKPDSTEKPYAMTYGDIMCLLISSNGELIVLENQGCSWYSGGNADIVYGSEDFWNGQTYEATYYLRRLSADGTEISSVKLDIPEGGYIDSRSLIEDEEGNILIGMSGEALVAIKGDGSTAYEISLDGRYLDRLFKLSDGRVLAMLYGDNGDELCELDVAGRKFGASVEKPQQAYDLQPGAGGYDLCYTNGLNLYGFNIGEEPVKLLNWMDADVNNDGINGFSMAEDGSIVGFRESFDRVAEKVVYELFHLTKQPYDAVPHKQELTLGVQWLDYAFKDTIINYNRTNDKYRIVVKDYSEFNTEDDWEAGKTKLLTEIMSGDMPDMLSLNGLPYTQLASKGIIEDLYPYIQADPELKDAKFIDNVIKALEVDGKLCQLVPTFSVITAVGSPKAVGTEAGWTYDEFNAALANMPEGCMAFPKYVTRDEILGICLAMDMELYADWTTGQCHFDSPEFIALLEFVSQFPTEYEWTEEDRMEDEAALISSGMQMLSNTCIYNFDDIQFRDFYFGGESTYIGYPSASGNGSAFDTGTGYAITKNCSDKDAAWDFLRCLITEKYQDKIGYGMPTNRASFDKALKKAMTPEYLKDADGNILLDEDGERITAAYPEAIAIDQAGNEYEITEVTQAQADKLMELINSTTKLMDENSKIIEIVKSEAKPFFEGQKTAQDVAKLIQSKVNIYINEQR